MATIMVTGSRHLKDQRRVENALWEAAEFLKRGRPETITLLHGTQKGADKLSESFARRLKWEIRAFPPLMDGPGGFTRRNQAMVDAKPDICVAFPMDTSVGTWDSVNRAKKAGIEVWLR